MLSRLRARLRASFERRARQVVRQYPLSLLASVAANLMRLQVRGVARRKLRRMFGWARKEGFRPPPSYPRLEGAIASRARALDTEIGTALDAARPIDPRVEDELVRSAMALASISRFEPAVECLRVACRIPPAHSQRGIDYTRTLGIYLFMLGRMQEALPWFHQAGQSRRVVLANPGVPRKFRILGSTWLPAIGHIAMLDFLLKRQQLGWDDPDRVYFSIVDLKGKPGHLLAKEFSRLGIRLIWPQSIDKHYEGLREPGDAEWWQLTNDERTSLVQEFWELDFPDTGALFYTHAAAKIQNRWEQEARAPLMSLSPAQKEALVSVLDQLGVPRGAWFVCLHVRESGFHARWNKLYRSARDADIDTYLPAIEEITRRGGWVVRVGDASMKPLAPMPQVVDYARSRIKSELADILLCASCRFFLGTNSGLSIIPGIYGVPCLLTNWVPLGLPNWFGCDLVVPKLIHDANQGRHFTAAEIYSSLVGYAQSQAHMPPGVSFVENTPEELREATAQMLEELDDPDTPLRDRRIEQAYWQLAESLGSYRGSRMSSTFARRHAAALAVPIDVVPAGASAVIEPGTRS
jgi:putative glycosyltransferase (TIGR04372 family)